MKLIDFDMIKSLNISPGDCYNWVDDALRKKTTSILPPKTSMKPGGPDMFLNCMPAVLPLDGFAGVKFVTRYPNRTPTIDSQILLYDSQTGEALALMDGNWITAMRTGAVAAHSIILFARQNFETLGYIGLGNTARSSLSALVTVNPSRHLHIKLLKYKNQHEEFANYFKQYNNISFDFCDSYEAVIDGSDVVVSAVSYFSDDICPNSFFKEGCLIVPIHTRGFTNCDLFFDKVFSDDTDHVKHFKYFSRFKKFGETSDVLNAKLLGRENERERIIVYNIGIAMHDIYFAGKIYKMVKEAIYLSLKAPSDKFWV